MPVFVNYLPQGTVWDGAKKDPSSNLFKLGTAIDNSLPEADILLIPTECTIGSHTFTTDARLKEIGLYGYVNDTIRSSNDIIKWWYTQQAGNFSQVYLQSVFDYFYGAGVYTITQFTQFQAGVGAIGDAIVSEQDRFTVKFTRTGGSHSDLIKKIITSILPAGVIAAWL